MLVEGAGSGPTTRSRASGPAAWSPGLEVASDPYEACEAPTCSPCSPSGTSSAGSTSIGSASRCGAAASSTPATSSTRPRCVGGASPTRASVADAPRRRHRRRRLPRLAPLPSAVRRGWDVVALDNLLTGRLENIEDLLETPGFEFDEHDVTEFVAVDGAGRRRAALREPGEPADYLEYPIKTLKVGSLGTHNTLGLAKAKGARYLLASTSEVYGDPLVHPQPEDYWGNVNPVGPRGVYDEAKRFAEAMAMAYHRAHGLDVKIVRIFNTYGPGLRPGDGRVVSNFLVQALDGKPLTVYGDGSQTRSFCYVDDEVRGILALLESDWTGPMNIGNPDEFTVLELAEHVLELTGAGSEIVFEPLPVDDPHAAPARHRPRRPRCSAGSPRSTSATVSPAPTSGTGGNVSEGGV